ncbi:MAG: hypothetical protein ACHQ4J_11710 [Candidatus Binatia bacterium]
MSRAHRCECIQSALRAALITCWATFALTTPVRAQNSDQFGGQDRADAASRLIVLGIQRAVDALPLISGQSVTYEYDPASDALQRSTHLGPTVLRSSQTVGPGTFSVQLSTSYFELAHTFQPVDYLIMCNSPTICPGVAKLGLAANAHVSLINLTATYGLSQRVDVSASLPLTVVDAHASQIFSTDAGTLSVPASKAPLSGVAFSSNGTVQGAIGYLNQQLRPGGSLALRQEPFSAMGFGFNEGTNVGVGRIDLGAKGVIFSGTQLQLSGAAEFFLPSPSENAFAGPASAAILPRLIATFKLTDFLQLHSDIGYQYDFDSAELRRLTWDCGGSFAAGRAAVDLGVGGSEYDAPIHWTPTVAHSRATMDYPATTDTALESTTVATQFVEVLLGLKFRLNDVSVIAAGVSVPVINPAFQPDVLGTIAVERSF